MMYLPMDKVYIKPLGINGIVIATHLTKGMTEYYVRYYIDTKQDHSYFLEEEIASANP